MNVYDSTLTSKGQTTIPAEVRSALNLKPGDKIRYVVKGTKVSLRVKNKRAVDLAGRFHDPNRAAISIDEMRDAIGNAIVNRLEAGR